MIGIRSFNACTSEIEFFVCLFVCLFFLVVFVCLVVVDFLLFTFKQFTLTLRQNFFI